MSTKAIRELAEYVKIHFAAADLLADAALKEVEAIERAAKALPVPGVGSWDQPEWDKAVRDILSLMQSIAEDAP